MLVTTHKTQFSCFIFSVFRSNSCFGNKKLNKPTGYWNNEENISNFLHDIKDKLNLQSVKDWDKLTQNQIRMYGGSYLLKKFSLYEIKCKGYPEGKLEFKKPIHKKNLKYWKNKENINQFLLQLKENLNLKTIEDWNSLTVKQIKENGGSSLLIPYSMYDIKCMACPDGKFQFSPAYKTRGYWNNKDNIQDFVNCLKDKLNLHTIDDWNSITTKEIESLGGEGLLKKFSIYEIKCMGYPDGKYLFNKPIYRMKVGYWDNKENIQNFLHILKNHYKIKTSEDWNRISISQIRDCGGRGLLAKYTKKDILNFVCEFFDNNNSITNVTGSGRASQRWLFLLVQNLYPGEEIIEDYFHSEISRKSGFPVQFDVFLVSRKIAIEYHGKQHFEDVPSVFAPLELYNKRDKEKQKLCLEFGIRLIIIPHWWDKSELALKQTILNSLNKTFAVKRYLTIQSLLNSTF